MIVCYMMRRNPHHHHMPHGPIIEVNKLVRTHFLRKSVSGVAIFWNNSQIFLESMPLNAEWLWYYKNEVILENWEKLDVVMMLRKFFIGKILLCFDYTSSTHASRHILEFTSSLSLVHLLCVWVGWGGYFRTYIFIGSKWF